MDSVYTSLKHHFDGGAGASADLYYDENEIAEMEDELYDDNALPSPPYKHWINHEMQMDVTSLHLYILEAKTLRPKRVFEQLC